MTRTVFFSFHYDDIENANIIRNAVDFKPAREEGYDDEAVWEEARAGGDAAIKKLMDEELDKTSVTCFLLGKDSYSRPWSQYALEKSMKDGKGIFGICLPNQDDCTSDWISEKGYPVYTWDQEKFADWVELAAEKAGL